MGDFYALFLPAVLHLCAVCVLGRPDNVVLILTDDQDSTKTGFLPLPKIQDLIVENGATFTNAFATTPVCCPSRSSILSGLYPHNHGTRNNSVAGGCGSANWEAGVESNATFAVHLQRKGYTTFYAGKYLNQYGKKKSDVPAGWDWWYGLVGNSRYYNYTLSVNGTWKEYGDRPEDYLTDRISQFASDFLEQKRSQPFLMVLAPPACHDPFTPADRFRDRFANVKVPKGADFNTHYQDRHWLVRMAPHTLSASTVAKIDEIYRERLKTLLSVDDLVERVVLALRRLGLLQRTHLIFTSDHGFHMGQFGMPWDKRQPYEFDVRVPLAWRGPGVPLNVSVAHPALLIDLAPTLMQIAGVEAPTLVDGVALQTLLPTVEAVSSPPERTFLIEYSGEAHPETVADECNLDKEQFFECNLENECKCQDSRNNTYSCLRHISTRCNLLFCQFRDSEEFEELYDLNEDPLQLENRAKDTQPYLLRHYRKLIEKLSRCKADECRKAPTKIACM